MNFDDFTKMHVWQLAFELLLKIYKVTSNFPKEEKFGLVSDMRRAANSITHNIAEGFGRFESKDKTRFYKISRGSCFELSSQVLVSFALKQLNTESDKEELLELIKNIIKELNSLIKRIESPIPQPQPKPQP